LAFDLHPPTSNQSRQGQWIELTDDAHTPGAPPGARTTRTITRAAQACRANIRKPSGLNAMFGGPMSKTVGNAREDILRRTDPANKRAA
jgi:hypothetical protein